MDSRLVAYELLGRAILHIRAFAGPAERNYQMITALTYLIHNLPGQIEVAEREGGRFDELLSEMWARSSDRPLAHDWLASHLGELGIDVAQLPAAEGITPITQSGVRSSRPAE